MSGDLKGWEIRTGEIAIGLSPRYGVPYASGPGIRCAKDGIEQVRRLLEHYLTQAQCCRAWLEAMGEPGTPQWRAQLAISEAALHNGVSRDAIMGRYGSEWARAARRAAAREMRAAGMSLSQIGRMLGGRHHTTILKLLRGRGGKKAA